MTYYVLVLMRVGSRQICVAGFTLAPDSAWMQQTARNLTMDGEGFPEKFKPNCRILYPAFKNVGHHKIVLHLGLKSAPMENIYVNT
jgi:hypothetical protein